MRNKQQGVTLIEILLVLVVVSMMIWAGVNYMQQRTLQTRTDKTATQMQQILNASLAYYLANQSAWPPSLKCLQGQSGCAAAYLPPSLTTPFATTYTVTSNPRLFFVSLPVTSATASGSAAGVANTIAGLLPLSYTTSVNGTAATPPPAPGSGGAACKVTDTTCYVVASINVPGQALNTAQAVNFAGLYHHGGCVPVPTCPVDANGVQMSPNVVIVPVSVSGVNDPGSNQVYPISSFTASATGPAANPPGCPPNNQVVACGAAIAPASGQYWRACLDITTERGDVALTNPAVGVQAWGGQVTLMAITRCSPSGEPSGSPDTVYSR